MELAVAGHPVYVYTGGTQLDATLPAVVFVHGAQQDHSCWGMQSRWFAHHGFATLAPDLPGHGRSGGMPLESIEALAAWLIALLDAAGVASAMLVGHSMGALVVLEAAAHHADRIARLVLIGASVPMPVAAELLEAAEHDEPGAMAMINGWSHSRRGLMGGNAVPGMWIYESNRRLMERQRPGAMLADLGACNTYAQGAAAAPLVRCPVLIVAGTHDRMTPARNTAALAQLLPHATTVILPGAGHAMMSEQPDALLDALIGFARGQQ